MKKRNLLTAMIIAVSLNAAYQPAIAQKGKGFVCNCFLPDYGCNGKDKKCLSYCYRACEIGFLVRNNPSANSTTISLSLVKAGNISIQISDSAGKVIKTFSEKEIPKGYNEITWNEKDENGNSVTAGVYYVQLNTSDYSEMKKISLIK